MRQQKKDILKTVNKKHILATHGIANKGFSGLRSLVIRFNFCNGGQERSPQSLTSHTARTLTPNEKCEIQYIKMGDWRTLHLFDKSRYIKEIVPIIKDFDTYLSVFLNEERLRWLNSFSIPSEEILKETTKLVSELIDGLSSHPKLKELSRVKIRNIDNYYSHREKFISRRQSSIEFFEYLIIETIFSSVADFNPHFILGKSIFEGCIDTKLNSVAKELSSKLTLQNDDSILDLIDGGIINWLSREDVEMLYLDKENILPCNDESSNYVNEFKEFLKIAYERNLGLISMRNPRESDLKSLKNSSDEIIKIVRKGNFKHIVIQD
jgi:hypothetical protein